jgi:hypothetical protein
MGFSGSRISFCFLLLLSFTKLFSATYTTTAVAGTWDIGGSPTATDNIIVNHNWSAYAGFGTTANYSGTMTINSGGWLKLTGDFTNFSGNIDIKSGGTFFVTGSVTTASSAFGGSVTVNGTWRVQGAFANGYCTIAGSGFIRVDGSYSGGCNGSVTLPVELTSFQAAKNDDDLDLTWTTASEINSNYFLITRSSNGIDFVSIGKIAAAGSSNSILNYSFIDANPLSGTSYYQLVEYDTDGQTQKSKVIVVNFSSKGGLITEVFPNPSASEVQLTFNVTYDEELSLLVTDVLGNQLQSTRISASKGENVLKVSLIAYPAAQYFIRIVDANGLNSAVSVIKN